MSEWNSVKSPSLLHVPDMWMFSERIINNNMPRMSCPTAAKLNGRKISAISSVPRPPYGDRSITTGQDESSEPTVVQSVQPIGIVQGSVDHASGAQESELCWEGGDGFVVGGDSSEHQGGR